jgi:hypothetical protein
LKLLLEKTRGGAKVLMSIKNDGRGMEKAPYLTLTLPPNFRVYGVAFESSSRVGLKQLPYGDGRCHFGADANDVIHSGQTRRVGLSASRSTGQHFGVGSRHNDCLD